MSKLAPDKRVVMLLLAVVTVWAHAQSGADVEALAPPARRSDDAPEYGGVVTSQVITGLGHFFHAKFTEGWNIRSDVDAYILLVRERPSPRGGSEIQVLYNDQVVYRSYLPRGHAAVAALSESAVEVAYQNVVQANLQNLLFDDPDLARAAN